MDRDEVKGDGRFQWHYADAEDAETWQCASSAQDAIAQGRAVYEGDWFYICEADKSQIVAPASFDWLAEDVTTKLIEHNEDCFDPDNSPDPWGSEAIEDLERTLRAAVCGWLTRHPGKTWMLANFRSGYWVPGPEESRPKWVTSEMIAPAEWLK